MLKKLTVIANELDQRGLIKEADLLDQITKEIIKTSSSTEEVEEVYDLYTPAAATGSDLPEDNEEGEWMIGSAISFIERSIERSGADIGLVDTPEEVAAASQKTIFNKQEVYKRYEEAVSRGPDEPWTAEMSRIRDVELDKWLLEADAPLRELKGYAIIEAIWEGWNDGSMDYQEKQDYEMDY